MHSINQIRMGSISTSEAELRDILKAWVAVSIAFGIILSTSILDFYSKFVIASLTVGIGFLFHELGHKIVAQRYGCFAEFRSFDKMLLLAIGMSFFGFVFAAPGAVMISGRVSNSRNGKISAAGPLVNIILALIFLGLSFLVLPKLFKEVSFYGFVINSWLALFNMIPFGMFDGSKILRWNKFVYGLIVGASVLLMLVNNFMKFTV